jgi:hypothetical protein
VSDGSTPSFGVRLLMGTAFAAGGVFPILAAFDVGPFKSSSINGPPWIGIAAGSIFLAGAFFIWFHGPATRRPWLGGLFAFAMVSAFASLTNWIAFGPGPRECSSTVSLAMFTTARWVTGLECRIAFGIGAVMCNGLLLLIAGRGLTQAGVANALPGVLDKVGTWLILAAFAPLVMIFVVAKLVEQGAKWCWARVGANG